MSHSSSRVPNADDDSSSMMDSSSSWPSSTQTATATTRNSHTLVRNRHSSLSWMLALALPPWSWSWSWSLSWLLLSSLSHAATSFGPRHVRSCRRPWPILPPGKHALSFVNVRPRKRRTKLSTHHRAGNSHGGAMKFAATTTNFEEHSPSSLSASISGNDASVPPVEMEEEMEEGMEIGTSQKVLDNYFGRMLLDSDAGDANYFGRNENCKDNVANGDDDKTTDAGVSRKRRRWASGRNAWMPRRPWILQWVLPRASRAEEHAPPEANGTSQQPNRKQRHSSLSGKRNIRNSFGLGNRKKSKRTKENHGKSGKSEWYVSKEEMDCPVVVSDIHGLREAVLVKDIPLRDVGFRFPWRGIGSELLLTPDGDDAADATTATKFQRNDPVINGTLSSYLTCQTIPPSSSSGTKTPRIRNHTTYQRGIELLHLHPVLSLVRERVLANSTPGNRKSAPNETATPHLALVIEGGGMRGAVSAGMAAALSTLDLLDAFDSIHGSSAGAIVGAYLVSRQLCTDVYTDIMPAAGSRFASSKRVMWNVGVDWLGDLIQRKLLASADDGMEEERNSYDESEDELCVLVDDGNATLGEFDDGSSWMCDDDSTSVELAMGKPSSHRRRFWNDDHYDGIMHESANYLLSIAFSFVRSTVSRPLSFGMRQAASAMRPALSALDFASSMRQYLRRNPGMNITFVLDGVMDETHGLRPFDLDAFRANDKMQPLYVIASTVSRGGSGDMETIAFNSADGDFFGLSEDDTKFSKKLDSIAWYKRVWHLCKRAPYAVYSAVRSTLFSNPDIPPVPSPSDPPLLPPGSNAMYGFTYKQKNKERNSSENKLYEPTGRADGNGKNGLFPCLEASMLVPGAAGPPIRLIRSMNRRLLEKNRRFPTFLPIRQPLKPPPQDFIHTCYDAFVYESIPYRSAVEKAGATHVLALRSRPDGCVVETRQHIYERVVGPIYFRKHGMNKVARLFSSGGSQYRYIEDVLTLDEGLANGIALGLNSTALRNKGGSKGVKIPPTKILYGDENRDPIGSTDDWKEAHLLPLTLPFGTPELPALTQDKEEVMNAVRYGYAAAFDVLAPVAGLPFDSKTIPGERVAELIFPDGNDEIDNLEILDKRVKVKPSYIHQGEEVTRTTKYDEEELIKRRSFAEWITGKREKRRKEQEKLAAHPGGVHAKIIERRKSLYHESDQYVRDDANTLEWLETEALLAALPGFRGGRLDHIADSLLSKDERMKEKKK